jgi:hypothetical protein
VIKSTHRYFKLYLENSFRFKLDCRYIKDYLEKDLQKVGVDYINSITDTELDPMEYFLLALLDLGFLISERYLLLSEFTHSINTYICSKRRYH